MGQLRALHNGQIITTLELESGVVYYAGRSSQCQIVLPEERGISRQHLKISEENGIWTVTKLSKYGHMVFNNQNVEVVHLDNDLNFSVGGFEFVYQTQAHPSENLDLQPIAEQSAAPTEANSLVVSDYQSKEKEDVTSPGNFEATRAGVSHLVPYLKILNQNNQHEEILKLEGQLWTIGRSPSSEVYINDAAISRKHFELSRSHEGYFITDHNSSNGTELNGEKIEPQIPHQIRSGDIIQIKNIKITFEIRNSEFEKILLHLPAVTEEASQESSYHPTQIQSNLPAAYDSSPADAGEPFRTAGVVKVQTPLSAHPALHNRKVQIGAAFVLLFFIWIFMDDSKPQKQSDSGQQELGSKKEVTPEQMNVVKEKYELAKKNYFERANYTFCRDLLNEVHQIVPFFEDSKNLASLCEQSIELQLIRQEREEKERKKIEAENKIKATISNCQSLNNNTTTYQQMQECLAPALELDPGSSEAQVLLKQIEERDLKKQQEQENKKLFAQRVLQGRQHFNRANQHESSGRLRSALQEYNSFLQKNYPGLGDEEEKARRAISSIQRVISQKVAEKVNQCKSFAEQKKYKLAIKSCDEALREDPQNGIATEVKRSTLSTMQKEFRSIYEDSRLEESMGNIEAAKQKWKKIMEDSFKGEEFHDKSKNLLKKYEG